jgi:hypothetical protein
MKEKNGQTVSDSHELDRRRTAHGSRNGQKIPCFSQRTEEGHVVRQQVALIGPGSG